MFLVIRVISCYWNWENNHYQRAPRLIRSEVSVDRAIWKIRVADEYGMFYMGISSDPQNLKCKYTLICIK